MELLRCLLPHSLRRLLYLQYRGYSDYYRTLWRVRHEVPKDERPRILFYHISGLSFAGTSKRLQILAKHMNTDRYSVYYMYSPKPRPRFHGPLRLDQRLTYLLGSEVKLIPFDYDELEETPPYFVRGMSPGILKVLSVYDIDLLVTVGAGYSEFPINIIRRVPIILFNAFGAAHDQRNIVRNVCNSHDTASRVRGKVPPRKIEVMYAQSEAPSVGCVDDGWSLRRQLGIADEDIVFGRIGRASDDIFDPIGIRAFQRVIREKPWIHYLIMSPPPALEKIVADDHIPNVHFLPPSGEESDVWAFHSANDVFAHFRRDGETCGLSIGEAMLCGKPIITHRSFQWNAHLEYLDESCAFVAAQDNVEQYAQYLSTLADDRERRRIREMGRHARKKAEPLFLIQHSIARFEGWVDDATS